MLTINHLFCNAGMSVFDLGRYVGCPVRINSACDIDGFFVEAYNANKPVNTPAETAPVKLWKPPKSHILLAHPTYRAKYDLKDRSRGEEFYNLRTESLVAQTLHHIDQRDYSAILMEINCANRPPRGLLYGIDKWLSDRGYWVHIYRFSSASYGSVESRKRTFISATQEGVWAPAAPFIEHNGPKNIAEALGLPITLTHTPPTTPGMAIRMCSSNSITGHLEVTEPLCVVLNVNEVQKLRDHNKNSKAIRPIPNVRHTSRSLGSFMGASWVFRCAKWEDSYVKLERRGLLRIHGVSDLYDHTMLSDQKFYRALGLGCPPAMLKAYFSQLPTTGDRLWDFRNPTSRPSSGPSETY